MKNSLIILFVFLLSTPLFTACIKEDVPEQIEDVNIEKIFIAKYQLIKSIKSTVNTTSINSKYSIKSSKKVTEYSIKNSNEKVLIFVNYKKPNNYIVIKGFYNNFKNNSTKGFDFHIIKELSIEIQMNNEGNGLLYVESSNKKDSFKIELSKGKPDGLKNTSFVQSSSSIPTEPVEEKLCQIEEGETTKSCYIREVDEFCDGFWGCAGLTQVSVHVLILALCSC